MNDTSPDDTSGGAASANTVRGCSGNAVGPSVSHYILAPLQKATWPEKKKETAMSRFLDTHHSNLLLMSQLCPLRTRTRVLLHNCAIRKVLNIR